MYLHTGLILKIENGGCTPEKVGFSMFPGLSGRRPSSPTNDFRSKYPVWSADDLILETRSLGR